MRIGIDIRPLQSSSAERGIGYYVRGLLAGLSRAGAKHQYVLLTIAGRPVPKGIDAGLNAAFVSLPLGLPGGPVTSAVRYLRWLNPLHAAQRGMRYDHILRRRWDMQRLARAARKNNLDVLHLTSVFEPEYFASAAPAFPCPVVQTVHDLIPEALPEINRAAGWPYGYGRKMGLRSLAEAPGRIVAISESARRDTERFVSQAAGRVEVAYNGVDARFAPQDKTTVARVISGYTLSNRAYIMTNGGIEWRKNLPTVFAAVAQLTGVGDDLRVVVPGRLSESERALAHQWREKAGLAEARVLLPGFVPDDHLPSLYAGAVALVFPSHYEGFGLPVAEAMRCRCPVIAARNSSLPEVGGDAAIYVENADDAANFAQSLTFLLENPAMADNLRDQGAAWAQKFDWNQTASLYVDLYSRLSSGMAEVTPQELCVADRL